MESMIPSCVIALVHHLIFCAWTLPEVLHTVEHVSQCFIIGWPQTLSVASHRIIAADCPGLNIEDLVVE